MIKGKNVGLRAVEKEDLPFLKDCRNIPEFRNEELVFDLVSTGK